MKCGRVMLIGMLLAAACGGKAGSASTPISTTGPSAVQDVTVAGCQRQFPAIGAWGYVVNAGPGRADYTIEMTFNDDGDNAQLGSASTVVANVDPGQQANWRIDGRLIGGTSTTSCRIAAATRRPVD